MVRQIRHRHGREASILHRLEKGPLPLAEALDVFQQLAEALAYVVLETSDEPLFVTNVDLTQARIGGLGTDVARRFLEVLAENAGLVLHVRLLNGTDSGHVLDAIFKGLGAALAEACERQGARR